jgi:hypothetical protein
MQNENNHTGGFDGVTVQSATPEAVYAPAPAAPAPAVDSGKSKSAAVAVPPQAFSKIKAEQRERGRREAMKELEEKFRSAGFNSLDDALSSMSQARSSATQAPQNNQPQRTQPQPQYQQAPTSSRADQRLARERERLAKQVAQEQALRRKLQRKLDAKEAEFALREAAVSHGVKDVDYALRLLQRELEGKNENELEVFDEAAFFNQKLRSSHPYLFGEMVMPATTGTGVGGAPTAPTAGNVQAAQGASGQVDARSMSSDEFQKLLRKRGLSPVSA